MAEAMIKEKFVRSRFNPFDQTDAGKKENNTQNSKRPGAEGYIVLTENAERSQNQSGYSEQQQNKAHRFFHFINT